MKYLLRFQSLHHCGKALSFPCDENGIVNTENLSVVGLTNYYYALEHIGTDFSEPVVITEDSI